MAENFESMESATQFQWYSFNKSILDYTVNRYNTSSCTLSQSLRHCAVVHYGTSCAVSSKEMFEESIPTWRRTVHRGWLLNNHCLFT